jgi:predicted DNA-binding transcriptional regulator AlpA
MNTLINTTVLEEKDLLTIEELSETLRMSQNTIYRISFRGELKPLKYRGRNYWKSNEVIKYLTDKGINIL